MPVERTEDIRTPDKKTKKKEVTARSKNIKARILVVKTSVKSSILLPRVASFAYRIEQRLN